MSTNDSLKSIFDRVFAREKIPFDPGAWQQMESMLDAQPRHRAGFFWLFSGMALVAAAVAFALLKGSATEVYQPRLAGVAFAPVETGSTTFERPATRPRSPLPPVAPSPDATPTQEARQPESAGSRSRPAASNATPTAEDKGPIGSDPSGAVTEVASATTVNRADSSIAETTQGATVTAPPGEATAITLTAPGAMEPLGWALPPLPENELVIRNREANGPQRPGIQPYLRLGLVKTAESKTLRSFEGYGQVGGAGLEWRPRGRFLLDAEASLYRERVLYSTFDHRNRYGYFRVTEMTRVDAMELISAEFALLMRYRMDRWTIGTGASGQFLLASRIEERFSTTATASDFQPSEEVFSRYARWSALSSFNVNLPVQVTYQLNENYFVGLRYRQGFIDLFQGNAVMDRKSALELFIRMNL